MSGLWQAFCEAGLLPEPPGDAFCLPDPEWGCDVFDSLLTIWRDYQQAGQGVTALSRGRVVRRLEQWQSQGARLTWGVPDSAVTSAWLGSRLAWWPQGVPSRRRIGLVSSRLGRDLSQRQPWFAALRTACLQLDAGHDHLVTAQSITTQRYVQRAAQLFGLEVFEIAVGEDGKVGSGRRWGQTVLAADPAQPVPRPCVSFAPLPVSPPPSDDRLLGDLPLADRAVLALSERLIVLAARPRGNVQRLVDLRLQETNFPAASVYLALGPHLVPSEFASPWMASGAVGWHLHPPISEKDVASPAPWNVPQPRTRSAPIRKLPPRHDRSLLTHWTRQQAGPWPDQSPDDYLDDLILDRGGADHSALAALCRIVRTRRLLATNTLIRGGARMVCFTEVPLDQLPHLRAFRSHLSRWDFELYGICIDRSWLEQHGGRPVRYGEPDDWHRLSEAERPYFQTRFSRNRGGEPVDWSIEREWRHAGDLSLEQLPAEAALVFVPEVGPARKIATISPWPVIVLPSGASRY